MVAKISVVGTGPLGEGEVRLVTQTSYVVADAEERHRRSNSKTESWKKECIMRIINHKEEGLVRLNVSSRVGYMSRWQSLQFIFKELYIAMVLGTGGGRRQAVRYHHFCSQ